MVKFLLFVVAGLVAAWVVARLRRGDDEQSTTAPERLESTGRFHAVSIKFAEDACCAAKQRAGERFLASSSPDLPLPDCDAKRCECSFAHHDDRRRDFDRRSPFNPSTGTSGTGLHKIERRQGKDRRDAEQANSGR